VVSLCTTRLHDVYGISWSPRCWSRLRTWWLSTQRNFRHSYNTQVGGLPIIHCLQLRHAFSSIKSFRHSYNPQVGGLPIVRCLQLRHTFSSIIRVLGMHTTLQLEGYSLSAVSSYTIRSQCHPSFRSSSNLQVEGHPLSVISISTVHSVCAGRFLHHQPQHALRWGDRDTTCLEVPAEIQLRISRLHVHWSTVV